MNLLLSISTGLWIFFAAALVAFAAIFVAMGRNRRLASQAIARKAALDELRRRCFDSYVTLSTQKAFNDACRDTVKQLVPYVDRLGQILSLPDIDPERRERMVYEQIVNNLLNLASARAIDTWHLPKPTPPQVSMSQYLFTLNLPATYDDACSRLSMIDRHQLSELEEEMRRTRFSTILSEWIPALREFTQSHTVLPAAETFLKQSKSIISKYEI